MFTLFFGDGGGVERPPDHYPQLLVFIFEGRGAQGLVRVLQGRGCLGSPSSAGFVWGGTQENVFEAETLGATAEKVGQSLFKGGAAT